MSAVMEKPKREYQNSPFIVMRPNYLDKSITVISYAEAAEIAGVAVATLYKWVRLGRLNMVRKLGAYRIDKGELYNLLHTGKNQGTPPKRKKAGMALVA
jgi:excisionase family DNA binding protein